MDSTHVELLSNKVSNLLDLFGGLSTSNDLAEIQWLMKQPGFTSPVEAQFISDFLDAAAQSVLQARQIHDSLVTASRAIAAAAAPGAGYVQAGESTGSPAAWAASSKRLS